MKFVKVKLENVNTRFLIDTGSSSDIIDKTTFEVLRRQNPRLKHKETKKRLYPYASRPIEILGYF